MKRLFFFVTLLFVTSVISATPNNSIGKKRSEKAYRYEITPSAMQQIIEGKVKKVTDILPSKPSGECIVEEVDTINSGIGRWIWSWIDGAELRFRVENNVSFRASIYGEENGVVAVMLKDADSSVIKNASVTLAGKALKFNSATLCYEIKTPKLDKTKKLIVRYGDEIQSYDILNNGGKEHPYRRYRTKYQPKNSYSLSYLVLDKPEYRPNDSIRWKAVIMNISGKYEKQPLELWLEPIYYSNESKKLGTVNCERIGVYMGSFQIADSMGLSLNSPYKLVLKNKQGSIATTFQYKDYELKSLTANVSTRNLYTFGDTCVMTIDATDEKGDKITSGTAKIRMQTTGVNYIYDNSLFVPEVLCDTIVTLSSSGTTLVNIDTKTWPEADMYISWQATITDNTFEKVNQYGGFNYRKNDDEKTYTPSNLSIQTIEQADSIGFIVNNPDSLLFRYAIYQNKKIVASASVKELDWRLKSPKEAVYTLIVNAGNDRLYQTISYNKNGLRLVVEQPENIAPGSNAEITVTVYDSKGNPVPNAELTALSRTTKFGSYIQPLPSVKKDINLYIRQLYSTQTSLPLKGTHDYSSEIRTLMGVDSLDYYRMLTHSDSLPYHLTKPSTATTIAPYVVNKGKLQPVEVVYIDHKPVYISRATNTSPYVFAVKPGRHNITIRTADALYQIYNVNIKENTKNWIALKARDAKDKKAVNQGNVSSKSMPAYLTADEQKYFGQYGVMPYTVSPQCGFPYVRFNDGSIVALTNNDNNYYHSGVALMPETSGQYHETDSLGQNMSMRWLFVPDATTNIYPIDNLILARQYPSNKKQTLNSNRLPQTDDSLLTEELFVNQWQEYVNARRKYMYVYWKEHKNYGNCRLNLIYENGFDHANTPLNIIMISDSDTTIFEGNRRYFYQLNEKCYRVILLFKDAKAFSFKAKIKASGTNCIMLTNNMSAEAKVYRESVMFDNMIKSEVEKMLRNTSSRYVDLSMSGIVSGVDVKQRSYGRAPLMYAKSESNVLYDTNAKITEDAVDIEMSVASPEFEEESVMDGGMISIPEFIDIRSNFNEVAYWQPDLVTDKDGKITFTVTYPDDLTRWNEFFIAIKGRQRGMKQTSVVTRKDVVAQLSTPRFAIEGDSVNFIGRAINYSDNDNISCTRSYSIDGQASTFLPNIKLNPSVTDLLPVNISTADSVSVLYSINHGITTDGELRSIPVYKKGLEGIFSQFDILSDNSTITVNPLPDKGEMTIYFMSDMLSVLMDEITRGKKANYNTNDLLASNLLSLLAEKQIREYRGEKFKSDYEVRQLINRLETNRLASGLWSWQGSNGAASTWVSAHVFTALKRAQSLGYSVDMVGNKPMLIQYLVQYSSTARDKKNVSEQLTLTEIMLNMGYTNESRNSLADIDKTKLRHNDLLQYQLLSSQIDGNADLTSMDSLRRKDMLGGEYYAFKRAIMPLAKIYYPTEFFDLQTTMLAYRLWIDAPESQEREQRLKAMEQWILRQRRGGRWANEYMSSQIVYLLLPRFIATKGTYAKSEVKITQNGEVISIDTFPKTIKLSPEKGAITIEKRGTEDIYVSATQTWWNCTPERKSGDFIIDTKWQNPTLVRGETAKLIVTVTADKEAEYVVVSIPVPSGCSYNDRQPRSFTEIHREEYRNKVNIYCERMSAGTHTFEIDLTPRFNGRYTINPAQVKMIYFPVFNANNEMKQVEIE